MSIRLTKYLILTISALFVWLFIREIDWGILYEQLDTIGSSLFLVLLLSALAYACASTGWILCFGNWSRLNKFNLYFLARQVGESFGTLNPIGAVGGDALKYFLIRAQDSKPNKIIPSILCARVVMWIAYVFLVIAVLVISGGIVNQHATPFLSWVGIITLLGIACVLLVRSIYSLDWLYNILTKITSKLNSKYLRLAQRKVLSTNYNLTKITTHGKRYIYLALLFFVIHYLLGALEFYYILLLLHEPISFVDAVIAEIGTSFVRSVVLFIPGQVGVEEFSNKFFLELAGVGNDKVWITVSIIRRIRQLCWMAISAMAYWFYFQRNVLIESNPKLS